MPHQNSHYYEFGPYRLDVGQGVLTRTGETVSLPPKATEILTLLVVNAGKLVGKDELLNRVWPDTFVEESNLAQNIFLLRRILGDERPGPRYIETVVRRGYRFIANVTVIGGADQAESSGRQHGDDSLASRAGHDQQNTSDESAAPPTLAVLPFINATGNDDLEYLADGLTENLVNNLSRVSKLRVMSRSAVFRYKAKKFLDPRGVGKELGVGVVLVGKLTASPQGLGIGLELMEVSSGWQLWGDNINCQPKDILEIQDRITRQLLSALRLKLTGEEERSVTARYTENAEAYQSYLEARYHWSKYTRRGIEKAIIHFRHAIELDPNYALAYEGIIDCYLRLTTNYLPPDEDLPNTLAGFDSNKHKPSGTEPEHQNSEIVQPKDGRNARVQVRFEWDWRVAARELQRAHDLRSNYLAAHQWYSAYRLAKDLYQRSLRHSDICETADEWRLPTQILSVEPSIAEQLQALCAVARGQIAVCNYEAAEIILKRFSPPNQWPKLDSLTTPAAADLLFTLGILTASVATTRQTKNGYRRAAAYLNGAIALFEHLNLKSCSAEARAELARCYYRQGFFDIARETLVTALIDLPDDQLEIRCRCLIYSGMLERDAGRVLDAMSKLREAAALIAPVGPLVSVRYHLEVAGALRDFALCEEREEHNNEAQFHYRAGLYLSEAIGDHRTTATIENNFGLLLLNLQEWKESEKHLLRSHEFFEGLRDKFRGAQVNETLARLYLATERYSLAENAIENSIQTLESTDSEAILCEALTTGGIVLSKLSKYPAAKNRFEAAYKVAERCGDREGGRRALVTIFSELRDHLDAQELRQVLTRLTKLNSVTEQSTLESRVKETIAHIEAISDS